jgi:hypothetical protein
MGRLFLETLIAEESCFLLSSHQFAAFETAKSNASLRIIVMLFCQLQKTVS